MINPKAKGHGASTQPMGVNGPQGAGKGNDKKSNGSKRESKGNPAAAREAAFQRRRFIYEKLRERTRLTFKSLNEEYGPATRAALEDDVEFFRKLGVQFSLKGTGADSEIIDDVPRYTESYGNYSEQRVVEKNIISKVAVGLILGNKEAQRKAKSSPLESCPTQAEITAALEHQNEELAVRIADHWRETTRLVALDASSTNEQTASMLSRISLPSSVSNLGYLSLCTNSRNIFNVIGAPQVPIRAIVTGGQQRGHSATLAGVLTEYFLRNAALLQFGVALVGAIGIDVETRTCLADSQEEMIIKQLFLAKASTRVIVADNSKIKRPLQRNGYAFAKLHKEQVDLVITNCPLTVREYREFCARNGQTPSPQELKDQEAMKSTFNDFIKGLRKSGIAFLVGQSPFTTKCDFGVDLGALDLHFSENEVKSLHQRF